MMALLTWLESTVLSTWVREGGLWGFPTILTVHTFGLAVLVGSSSLFDLRLLGVGRLIPLGPMRSLFRVMWVGFWINAATGLALFVADATARGTSSVFIAKLALVGLGVATIVLLERHVYTTEAEPVISATARRLAVASLVIWLAAITAGRLLAYIG